MERTIGVILAAGKGTRLKTISETPKALKKIAGKSILFYSILRFIRAGIKNIYIAVRGNINEFQIFTDNFNYDYKCKIRLILLNDDTYIDSPVNDLIHTINSVKISFDNILVSYCDIITNFDYRNLINIYKQNSSLACMLLFQGDVQIFNHKYSLNDNHKVISIGISQNSKTKYSNAGIFIINKELLNNYDPCSKIFFDTNGGIMEKAYKLNSLFALTTGKSFFFEVGTIRNFILCNEELNNNPQLSYDLTTI